MHKNRIPYLALALAASSAVFIWTASAVWAAVPVEVHITNPKYDSQHASGEKIFFTASVRKGAIDVKGLSMVWTSNLDGKLGTGAGLVTDNLSTGIHRITLEVTDKTGIVGSDTIKIKVSPAPANSEGATGFGTDAGSGGYIPNPFN